MKVLKKNDDETLRQMEVGRKLTSISQFQTLAGISYFHLFGNFVCCKNFGIRRREMNTMEAGS